MRHVLTAALLTLCICQIAAAAPTTAATRLVGEVRLDGVFDEPAWQQAVWQGDFVSASAAHEGEPPLKDIQTRFAVLYDDDALYVAIEADEPEPENIRAVYTRHDEDVYTDDCVEVFLDPAGEGRYFHHWVVNTNGAWYDDYAADYGLVHAKLWDSPLEVGVRVDAADKVWRAEVRIPFAALILHDDAGPDWLFNVTRERYAGGRHELSTWSPLRGSFHTPRLFGTLTGVEVDFRRFKLSIGEPRVAVTGDGSGRHRLSLQATITNHSPFARRVALTAGLFLEPLPAADWPSADLAPGGWADFDLPPLVVRGDARNAVVHLTVADAETGRPYKIEVKHLNAEYRPLAAEIIQPSYRQNIYATQDIPELVFRVVLSEDMAARTGQVVYSLHDAADRSVREGKASVEDIAEAQRLEVGTLEQGTYTLRLRALDRDDETLLDEATTVRKLPPARGSEVRIDEHRNIVVNGEAKVFIGWYGGVPLEDPRPEVLALQNVQTPVVLPGEDPEPVRRLFDEHGIYSVVSIEPGRLYYTFNWWRDRSITLHEEIKTQSEPSEELISYLRRLVDAVKDEPGLLGYYLADEPEINDARSDYLEAMYRIMQELDPYHPVMITNDTLDGIRTHGYRACDILNPDPYSPAWDYVPNFMKRVHEVSGPDKGIMLTPWHSSSQAHFVRAWGTGPMYPYRVVRNQYLVALAYGSRGFTGYTSAFFMPEPILRYGLPPIWREVRFLEAAMANPREKPGVEADAEMASWLGEAEGNLYLVVVNHKPGARRAVVSHPLLAGVTSLDVVAEGRTVNVQDGRFGDEFAEGDARIYSTDPAGRALPTIAQVEQEIADREATAIKPGNLLHVSRGVRARASEGYFAPWFHQYYYYAINGITDDDGWRLSHTDKPSWLELTLPEAQPIGRVVVYSPNLGDYDLQFQGPDGAVRVAEVRGSVREVETHRFDPPVETLKLRITALSRRDGEDTKGVIVREIEAYAEAGAGPVTAVRIAAPAAVAPAFTAPAHETAGEPVLWREDFTDFRTAERYNWDGQDDKWVFKPEDVVAEPQAGGGIVYASRSPRGYAGMTHIFPYDPEYRYLQVSISGIEGEGYRWAHVGFGSTSGAPGFRNAVHTARPGIYTVDTHYVHDSYRTGEAKTCFVTVSTAGSSAQPNGTVQEGPRFTFDYLQLVRRPRNGLIVTLADGSPLPETLRQGDALLYRLYLEEPALDVTVEALTGSSYAPLPINGEPYVQLQKAGDGDGREWAAQVTLGEGTGKVGASGYPVMFRAVITGGAIPDACQTAAIAVE